MFQGHPGHPDHGINRMKFFSQFHLLITIVDWNKRGRVKDAMRHQRGPQYLCRAQGTASSDLMDLLGLGSADKALVWSFAPAARIPAFQQELDRKTELHKAGKGISFSVPLSGVMIPLHRGGTNLYDLQKHFEDEVENMNKQIAHDLIVAVVDEGQCEDVMAAARSAGAQGGTTFHTLRFGMEDVAQFFGIPVQDKKDVIAILTTREQKLAIMQAIGLLSDKGAHTLLFALPAANVSGLGAEK